MSSWDNMGEAEAEMISCLTDHFSAWSEYVKYIAVYREKEETERMARYEKEQALDEKVHNFRVLETCMNIWKIWLQTNSTKAKKQLAQENEVETMVGGMRYLRVRGGKKPAAPIRPRINKPVRKKAETPELAQIVQRPRSCEPAQFLSIATLQDRTMVEYSMQKLKWAPREMPFMRGRPHTSRHAFAPETAAVSKPKTGRKNRRKPAAARGDTRREQTGVSSVIKTTGLSSTTTGRNTVWGAAQGKSSELSNGVYLASARPNLNKTKKKKVRSNGTDNGKHDDAAAAANTNQTEDQQNLLVDEPLKLEEVGSSSSQFGSASVVKSVSSVSSAHFDIHSSTQFRPAPPVASVSSRRSKMRVGAFERRELARKNRRKLRNLQAKKLNRPNPTTAAGLEAAAEDAVARGEDKSKRDSRGTGAGNVDEFPSSSSANYTVDSKPLTFSANLSLAF